MNLLNQNSPKALQPQNVRLQLKQHQLTTLYKMVEMDQTCKNANIDLNLGILADLAGYGKCHGKGTSILMYNGEKKLVENIVPGDLLMGPDSKQRTVLTINSGVEQMYKITLSNGDSFTANESHVLSLRYPIKYTQSNGTLCIHWVDESLEQKTVQIFDTEVHLSNYIEKIPNVLNITIKDYLNCKSKGLSEFKAWKSIPEYSYTKTIIPPLIAGELYATSFFMCIPDDTLPQPPFYKHYIIPTQYFINTIEQRRLFLNGVVNKAGSCLLRTTIKTAAVQILELAKSVGLHNSTISSSQTNIHSVFIDFKQVLDFNFKIEPITDTEYFGFTLSGDHLYCLGDYTITHNTITMVSLLCIVKEKGDQYNAQWRKDIFADITPYFGCIVELPTIIPENYVKLTLLIVPKNVLKHWCNHFNLTDLNYTIVTGKNYYQQLNTALDLYICTEDLYNYFVSKHVITWDRVIIDEPDTIYIPNMNNVKARFLWLISSTYTRIKHKSNRGFLKDLMTFRKCDYFVVKCADDYTKESFKIVEPEIITIECLTPHYIKAIRGYVNDSILEYINAGDIDGAIISLGGNVDTDKNIIDLMLRKMTNSITEYELKIRNLTLLYLSENEASARLQKYTEKLTFHKNRITEFKNNIQDSLENECVICGDPKTSPTIVPCCQNVSCGKCILNWLKNHNTCPFCRSNIQISDLMTIGKEPTQSTNGSEKLSKVKQCFKIINDHPTSKFLIVSQHIAIFEEIKEELHKNHINFGELTSLNKTEKVLENFRNGKCNVILLGTKYNGAGIEIPEATDVILIHKLEPSVEIQAIGRAQRPRRTCRLKIWKLFYQNEYTF